jgi:hypothetical protein
VAPTKTGSDKRPDAWLHVGAPGYGGAFEAIKTIIPCGRRDYSRLAAIAGGGRVRIQQSKAKGAFRKCKLHPA